MIGNDITFFSLDLSMYITAVFTVVPTAGGAYFVMERNMPSVTDETGLSAKNWFLFMFFAILQCDFVYAKPATNSYFMNAMQNQRKILL